MMEAQKVEAGLASRKIDDPGLFGMHLQVQVLHHDPQSPQALFGRRLAPAEDDEVVRIPHQHPQVPTSLLPHAVELVQDDVGQERTDHAALRRA